MIQDVQRLSMSNSGLFRKYYTVAPKSYAIQDGEIRGSLLKASFMKKEKKTTGVGHHVQIK